MSIVTDAVKDFMPKKKTKADKLRDEIRQKTYELKAMEGMQMPYPEDIEQEKKIPVIKVPPPMREEDVPEAPRPAEDKTAEQPEEQQKMTMEDILVETYLQVIELRKDVSAILGILLRK